MSIKRTSKIGGFVLVGAITVTVAVASYGVNKIRVGGDLHTQGKNLRTLVADVLPPPLFPLEAFAEATMALRQPQTVTQRTAKLRELEKEFNQQAKFWENSPLEAGLRSSINQSVATDGKEFWAEVDNKFLPALSNGDLAAAEASYAKLQTNFNALRDQNTEIVKTAEKQQKEIESATQSALWTTISLLTILSLAIIALTIGSIMFLIRKVLNPLTDTGVTMSRMAAGDLEAGRTDQHRDDEIGDMTKAIEVFRANAIEVEQSRQSQERIVSELSSGLEKLGASQLDFQITEPFPGAYDDLRQNFNAAIQSLVETVKSVRGSASSVLNGATEIRAASDDLALRNEQQAASLEETAAAMNQVTQAVMDTASSAGDVRKTIAEAHHEATDGGAVVARAVEAMAAIETSSQEISQIISVIDGIAFQTNLLALNAGVEAARAGDAGKGFAVVANEVRALAQRSADAAKDIKTLITASSIKVEEGVGLVGETGTLLGKIVERVGEIATLVNGIATSAEQQAINLQQVNGAVGEMDRMTQQNAAMVEQSTAAARSLADEANELTQIVSRFRTGGESNAAISLPSFAAKRKTAAAAPPPVSGNLALKQTSGDDDWSEF